LPRDSAGNFTLVPGNPVQSGEVIASTWANTTLSDVSVALTDSLDRYGRGGMLAPFKFSDGTHLLPGASWVNEPTTGFYRFDNGDLRAAVLTQDIMRWQSTGAQVWNIALSQWDDIVSGSSGQVGVDPGTATDNTLRWSGTVWAETSTLTTSATTVTVNGFLHSKGAGANSFRAGVVAGSTNQGDNSVAVGYQAGQTNQGSSGIAMGYKAAEEGQGNNATALGRLSGALDQGVSAVAVGYQAGQTTQGQSSVAVGVLAGNTAQGNSAVAIGRKAAESGQTNNAVAVGYSAGQTTQGSAAVAVGLNAGQTTQGSNTVAMGNLAGNDTQGASSVAVGSNAGQTSQGSGAVAVGVEAGKTSQASQGIAVGQSAATFGQKQYGVAVGYKAGETDQGLNSIAIGRLAGQTAQANNGIIINASAVALDDTTNGHIHIASDDGSLDFLTASGWSMSDDLTVTGAVDATAFTGDGSALTGIEEVPAGGTTGQVLAKASATDYDTEWVAAGGGGGSDLSIKDEGTELTAAATSIDFVGAGVTATNTGSDVEVEITGNLEREWANMFGPDKPFREKVWLSSVSQSLGAPLIALTPPPNNPRVYDWNTGGSGGHSFTQLDPTVTPGYADYSSAAPYTGHPRGRSNGYELGTVMMGLADQIANHFDVDVYITHTFWVGHGVYEYFNPFKDDAGAGEGTGYTEFVTQMQASSTALSMDYPDIFHFFTGDTDYLPTDYRVDLVAAVYRNFLRQAEHYADVIGPETRHLFTDQNNAEIFRDWRIYRTLFSTWQGDERAVFAPTKNYAAVDGAHQTGDSSVDMGRVAFETMISGAGKGQITDSAGSEYTRTNVPLDGACGTMIADADAAPTLVNQFNRSLDGTKLRIPFRTNTYYVPFGPFWLLLGDAPLQVDQILAQDGLAIRLTEIGTSNFAEWDITTNGVFSNGLPTTAGEPNHIEFTVNATPDQTGGTGVPASGKQVEISVVRTELGVPQPWYRDDPQFAPQGPKFSLPPLLPRGAVFTSAVNGDQDLPLGSLTTDGTIQQQPHTPLAVYDTGGNVETVAGDGVLIRSSASLTVVGLTSPGDEGIITLTFPEATNSKGLGSTKIRLTGRRTDTPSSRATYIAEYSIVSNVIGTAGAAADIHNTIGSAYNVVNPSSQSWSNDVNLGSNAPAGFLTPNCPIFPPNKQGQTWDWFIEVESRYVPYT